MIAIRAFVSDVFDEARDVYRAAAGDVVWWGMIIAVAWAFAWEIGAAAVR